MNRYTIYVFNNMSFSSAHLLIPVCEGCPIYQESAKKVPRNTEQKRNKAHFGVLWRAVSEEQQGTGTGSSHKECTSPSDPATCE